MCGLSCMSLGNTHVPPTRRFASDLLRHAAPDDDAHVGEAVGYLVNALQNWVVKDAKQNVVTKEERLKTILDFHRGGAPFQM